jgi:hypothetical protein
MNFGIFSLLAVVVTVLGFIASFFVFLAKKSAAVSASAQVAASSVADAGHSSRARPPFTNTACQPFNYQP